jgi:hypothetical protein
MAGVGSFGYLVCSPLDGRLRVLTKAADGISTLGGRIGDSADIRLLCER